ncbi:MAG: Gfo/Idh/MocA family oxidoreductase [bacterium]|nr:Gfo/Idh/MocA family oxidoreductase [bacterium]
MLGVAIQGAGNVSTEHINAYQNNPHTRVVAMGSRTLEGAQKKAASCGLTCDCFDDYDRLLDHPDVAIVSICTPPDRHASETIAAAEAGKHLLIEKPVAVTQDELKAMDAAVRKAGVKTVVSFVLRWNPMVQSIKHTLEKGWLGTPLLIHADYWHGPTNAHPEHFSRPRWNPINAGALVHGGCHAMDAARYVLNNDPIVHVSGISPANSNHPDPDYCATTVATVQFANGTAGKISASTEFFMPYVFNLEVFGDEGIIRNNRFYTKELPGQNDLATFPTILPDSGAVSHHPFQEMIDHLVTCIQTDTESHDSLSVAVNTHMACFAAEASAKNGSQPVLL